MTLNLAVSTNCLIQTKGSAGSSDSMTVLITLPVCYKDKIGVTSLGLLT